MGIFDFFSGDDAKQAAADQQASLGKAQAQGSSLLNQGLDSAVGSYNAGIAPFLGISDQAGKGEGAYADATGANGAEGTQRAIANFQASPGYNYAVNQALDNVQRRQASTGQEASGGTNVDLLTTAHGLADQDWQKYITNLLPFLGQNTQAASGILAGNAGKAGIQNSNLTNQANMAYGTNVGIGNAQANSDLADYNASANLWNTAINGVKAIASFIPGGGGGK